MARDGERQDREGGDVELVDIRVIPRARRDGVDGERAGRLLVRTTAAPVDGSANDAVIRIVASHLGVPRRDVEISSGHRSRDKTLRVRRPARPGSSSGPG